MSFLDDLEKNIANVANLEIKTIVGEATFAQDGSYTVNDEAKTMYSSVNLLQGDITSIIPESFLSPPYETIRQYHQAREEEGRKIIADNINCLKELATLARSLVTSKAK
ncbi:MAG: hypothetical protein ACI8WB_004725 [Phenylobacterium sp.]|jgi:hypothetical protein